MSDIDHPKTADELELWWLERKQQVATSRHDHVNHPPHYTSHPSGIEVIAITQHENFCRGNAIKYILRAGKKGDEVEDLRKAVWYLNREIERLTPHQ